MLVLQAVTVEAELRHNNANGERTCRILYDDTLHSPAWIRGFETYVFELYCILMYCIVLYFTVHA
jgi:hypothetical protein